MSDIKHNSNSRKKHENGSVGSYVIGFMLSLLFSAIPYYLVVNQTITGNTLFITILSFAMMQMVIQLTFFLHIGRGPKPKWNLFFFLATFFAVVVVVAGSVLIMNNIHYAKPSKEEVKKLVDDEGIYQVGGRVTGACQEIGINHQVVIQAGLIDPMITETEQCDTLTFINDYGQDAAIRFNNSGQSASYAGNDSVLVKKGKNKTITLSELGTYSFYDNLVEQNTQATLQVNPK